MWVSRGLAARLHPRARIWSLPHSACPRGPSFLACKSTAAAATAAPAGKGESTTTKVVGAVLFSSLVGYTAYLCSWQLKRYEWKTSLVQLITERVHADARPLAELVGSAELADAQRAAAAVEAAEFCRVTVRGEFDHEQQMLLGPRSAPPGAKQHSAPGGSPSGWDVVTPLRCEDGTLLLVNRGWVPNVASSGRREPAEIPQPRGSQHVYGVLKRGEQRNKWAQNTPAARRYVWLDLATMASECGSAPLLIVATTSEQPPPTEWPMARSLESFLDFHVSPTTHLVYASTWGALTVAGAAMTWRRFR